MKNRLNTDRPKLKSPSPEPYSREKSLSQDRRAKMISLELEKNTATFNTQHRDLKVSLNSLQSQYDSVSTPIALTSAIKKIQQRDSRKQSFPQTSNSQFEESQRVRIPSLIVKFFLSKSVAWSKQSPSLKKIKRLGWSISPNSKGWSPKKTARILS